MQVFFHEKEAGVPLKGLSHLARQINKASKQAKERKMLSMIFLKADNGNLLGIVVGGEATVLHFSYGHENPPYFASKGQQDVDEPILTCFLLYQQHTEFHRKHVIPFTKGLLAVHEFYESGLLPACIEWVEV